MASKFWVGSTGSWSDTTHWATSTGGAGSTGIPATGDSVTFDGASGGGTVTADAVSGLSLTTITAGAFTGTLDFNLGGNPNITISSSNASAINFSGGATRTINMGSGAWTLSGGGGFNVGTVTGLTPTFSNATLNFNGNSAGRTFAGGGQTYGAVTVGSNATKGTFLISGTNTFASLTVADGNLVLPTQGVTQTITGALTITGTSSAPSGLQSSAPTTAVATVSVGSASTIVWASIGVITKAGAGSITATNSFDLGVNTGITITGPSGGGGVVGVIGG